MSFIVMEFDGSNVLRPAVETHPEPEPQPPESFLDRNMYCYKLVNDQLALKGVALGRGWENHPFNVTKLSCYQEKQGKGDEIMSKKIDWD